MSSMKAKLSLWLGLLITNDLICLNKAEASQDNVSVIVSSTVQHVERLYNKVLQSSMDNCRERLQHLNDSNVIDKQYFDELDNVKHTEDYYSTAFFIFGLINSPLYYQQHTGKFLLEVLPGEKVSIHDFFAKVIIVLNKYFEYSKQVKRELMQNVTRWESEIGDTVVLAFLEFPQTLQEQVPELKLMDYMKQAKALFEGVAQSCSGPIEPSDKLGVYIYIELSTLTREALYDGVELLQSVVDNAELLEPSEKDRRELDKFIKFIKRAKRTDDTEEVQDILIELEELLSISDVSLEIDESEGIVGKLLQQFGLDEYEQNLEKKLIAAMKRIEYQTESYMKILQGRENPKVHLWYKKFINEIDIERKLDMFVDLLEILDF